MKNLRKWWKLGLLLVLALIVLQTGASLLVRTSRARTFLGRRLERSFGRPVEVRQYSAVLFPSPQLDALGITVAEDASFGNEYFLRADKLSAGLRWLGLLRGRFELGTLQLERPSLILTRNAEGRWNLERWLPAAPSTSSGEGARARSTPAYGLQKLEISDGRVNFKSGDDKMPFAFIQVEGSIEQIAAGRWNMDLQAEPWRSGVPLQLAGTVRVRGDIAGTSARLRPANFQVSWQKSSLADVFRLLGGRDFGVRGLFAAEATAESGAATNAPSTHAAPGDWRFSINARAIGIHRWDLTERQDNPRLAVRMSGRWNPGNGTMTADELLVECPRSNLRGSAFLKSIDGSDMDLRVDSLGIHTADLLDWLRAFHADIAEQLRAEQFFTGAAAFHGWPLTVTEAAFSSSGGRWTLPAFANPVEVRALRGGLQKERLIVEPFAIILSSKLPDAPGRARAELAATATSSASEIAAQVSLLHDLNVGAGGIRIEGQTARIQDVFSVANAFGKKLQNGWELNGKASADLHWDWAEGQTPAWNGRADLSQATLQVAGLNQPVRMESLRAEWRNTRRRFTLEKVAAFGANWSGFVEQSKLPPNGLGEPEIAPWNFQLQADRLDAAELDRWMGPRARPSWLQRLLPSGLGGAPPPPPPSLVLQRIRASGELRVDELSVERIKLEQFRAQAALDSLSLKLRSVQAQWSGGQVGGSLDAAFSPEPRYQIVATFERVAIAQTPWLARAPNHLAGVLSGDLQLQATGIGRDALLASLTGQGDIRLTNVELRGWDLPATMALGEWKTGTSHWASGEGSFRLSDGGLDLNSLRLTSPAADFFLKGSVSFSASADLTAESRARGRNSKTHGVVRYLQISGPLAEPKISLENATAQQPGD